MNDVIPMASTRPTEAKPNEGMTGNRGLQIEEALIFEQDSPGHCGVENVLCRLMCMQSMPRSAGRTRPTIALKFAPSQ